MKSLEEKKFEGGMNSDDENRKLPAEDYRRMLNQRNGSSDESNSGTPEHTKGNLLVPYDLPAGTNTVIKSFQDKENVTVIDFIHNSNKVHQIRQYFPDEERFELIVLNPILNFSLDSKITGADLVGDLLYWNEGTNPQRKIDIAKAKNNKQAIWNLYFDIPENGTVFEEGAVYEMAFRTDLTGPLTFSQIYTATAEAENNREVGAKEFAAAFNSTAGFKDAFTAKACGIFVEVTTIEPKRSDLTFFFFLADPPKAIAVPQNHYGPTIEETITAGKAPPHHEPKVEIFSDDTREVNHITGKVFQFRAKYTFDNKERTTLGPISVIPFDAVSCVPQLTDVTQNGIKIDFTDPRLNDLASLSLITKVTLYVREGNIGKWKMIKELDQAEFGIGTQVFHFFNENVYSVISDSEANKLFDSLPVRSGSQAVIKNRMWYGDNLEGYDPVCVDANLDVTYQEPAENNLFSVEGKIVIKNPFVLNGVQGIPANDYRFNQPIYDRGNGSVWGGFSEANVQNDIGSTHGQIIPLGGFVVYLAGTDHYAVSKQNDPDQKNKITLLTNNVFKANTGGIGKCNSKKDREKIKCAIERLDVFSTFEIKNVPPGKYILRVASHKTTTADLNDPSRRYQKTSTNVFDINGNDSFEVIITITDQGVVFGNIGTISILDLCEPSVLLVSLVGGGRHTSTAITGYVVDKDGEDLSVPPSEVELKSGTRIELARVKFKQTPTKLVTVLQLLTGFGTIPIVLSQWANNTDPHTYTDHNGYFFYAVASLASQIFDTKVLQVRSIGEDLNANFFNLDGSPFTDLTGDAFTGSGVEIVCRNTSDQVTDFSRTRLNLLALDQDGIGKPGVSLIITRGGIQVTDPNGETRLTIYGDTREFDNNGLRGRFNERVIYAVAAANCTFDFDPETELLTNIPIGQFSGEFNFLETFDLQDVIITQLVAAVSNALKRGGTYEFGLVYYDFINRSNTTSVAERIQLEIPFYTEKDPKTGIINPKGVPTVSWEINHEPPDFATHYQWVRTKNTFTNEYLQWAVNEIVYVDDFNNVTSFSNATKVKLLIPNIGTYKEKFPNSKVGIVPEPGWRVRFMYNDNGNFFSEYIDVEVLSFSLSEITIYKQNSFGNIDEGTVIEIYNPKLQVEDKIFFEFGECFAISEDEFGVRRHEGPTQNQDLANDVPATGVFQSGDAWYRRRNYPTLSGSRTLFIDDASVSDFYISRDQSIGRPNAESGEVTQQRKESSFRFSDKLFPGTNINGLSSFGALNDKDLPKENGKISHLQKSENVLLAIHSRRTTSIYIDERIVTSPGGTDNIVATDEVVGATRTLKGRFGTIHPESVSENKGNVYSWDVNKGEWIRYSVNGLYPISDYKFSNYFAAKARDMLSLPDPSKAKVYSTYDSFFDELVVSMPFIVAAKGEFRPGQGGIDSVFFDNTTDMSIFIVGEFVTFTYFDRRLAQEVTNSFEILTVEDFYINIDAIEAELEDSLNEQDPMSTKIIDETRRETLAFSERRLRWTTFYSYQPEYLGKTGVDIVSYKNGDLWRHNVNPIHNNFYGEQFTALITFVANGNPSKIETYTAMSVESDLGNWFVPEDGLTIPPNKQAINGMRSRVNLARFTTKEGVSYAEFLRDLNSPGFTDPNDALVNGRLLRGHVLLVTIEEASTELVTLYAVNIISIPSELSKSSE